MHPYSWPKSRLPSGSAGYDKTRRMAQKFGFFLEQIKVSYRLAHQKRGLFARPFCTQNRHEGGLAGGGVAAHRLAGFLGRALDVEQVVGDLEREAEIVGIAAQRGAQLG